MTNEEAIEVLSDVGDINRCCAEDAEALDMAIKALEQQPKTGRWIRWYEVIESADGKSTDHIPHCKCSECSTKYDPHSSQFIKYCPYCGAKMEVVEE